MVAEVNFAKSQRISEKYYKKPNLSAVVPLQKI